MFAFRNLKIGAKLSLLVIISSIGFAAFAAYAFYTLGVVRVNGPIYQGLARDQELVADILPPPSYIIESYLTASQILDAAKNNETNSVNALLKKASFLQTEYETRHTYWTKTLASSTNKEINQTLLVDSYQPAETYFKVFNDQFVTAVQSRQIEKADTIFRDQLTQAYEAHRVAIDKVVTLQDAAIKNNESQAEALVGRSTILLVVLAILTIGFVIGLGVFISRSVTVPVSQLTDVANQVTSGKLDARAPSDTTDEVGILAGAFNSMTSRLREILESLEQRVAARTRNLQLAAEVGRSISQVRNLDAMLKDACQLILKEFDLYYVQVYLTDPNQTTLRLEAGTGTVGEQLLGRSHSLPVNTNSINGRAAVEKRSAVISDTTQSAAFRQNPLLPDTRGEMAVPLIVADRVVGVLDMQSSEAGILTEEVLPAFEALAGQLAVAIQNANLLAEAEQARAEVEKQARRLVRTGWSEHLDAIHKPEQMGFVFDHNQVAPLMDIDASQPLENEKTVSASISVTGESLGSLIMEIDDISRREQASELVGVVARQVAQQIENLRLLESAERYRYEAEQAARLQTIEGWQKYMEVRATESLGYLYNTNEVLPHHDGLEEDKSRYALPLKVRDETIGKLVVQGLDADDAESVSLANAVGERLTAHIESLRQFEETKRGQVELNKRAQREQTLRQITSALRSSTDPEIIMRTAVRELGSILARRTVVQMKSPEQGSQAGSAEDNGNS